MALVAICVLEQIGHVGPTLKLARQLRSAGHEVVYVGQWESSAIRTAMPHFDEKAIRRLDAEGFRFLPILERALRSSVRGTEILTSYAAAVRDDPDLGPDHPAVVRMWGEQVRLLSTGSLARPLEGLEPDLWLMGVGAIQPLPFLPARLAQRCVRICVTLASAWNPSVPPINSDVVPGRGPASALRVQRAWLHTLRNKFRNPWKRAIVPWIFRFARAAGYPARTLDFTTENVPVGLSAFPLIVLCPPAFEFPGRRPRGVIYADAGLEAAAAGGEFAFDWLRPGAKLVYCGFGSRSDRRGHQRAFHDALIRTVSGREDLQCVLAHGGTLSPADFPHAGENVRLADWVPQYRLLEHASLFITHCGLGSVKEAVARGVPMILLPHEADQPGNAARAVAHGIGVRAHASELTADRLESLIDRIHGDPAMKDRARAMQREFVKCEEEDRAFRFVQARLAQISR